MIRSTKKKNSQRIAVEIKRTTFSAFEIGNKKAWDYVMGFNRFLNNPNLYLYRRKLKNNGPFLLTIAI